MELEARGKLQHWLRGRLPLQHCTCVEAGYAPWRLPIVVWAQKDYMADLSQWYRNVKGYGAQIEIGGSSLDLCPAVCEQGLVGVRAELAL
jgi:hypothetical protein